MAVERFEEKGAASSAAAGRLDGPRRVVVGDQVFEARRAVVVNTGTKAFVPPIDGTGRDPLLDQPRGHRDRGGPRLARRARRRRHRGRAGPGLLPLRGVGSGHRGGRASVPPEEPEAGELIGRGLRPRGHRRPHLGPTVTGVGHDGGRFTVEIDAGPPVTRRDVCWWPPAATSISAAIGAASIGIDETRTGPCPSTTISGWSTGCGPWATSPAKGPSPTCRCTRPTSWSAQILGRTGHPGRLPGRAPGHLHRSRGRIGGAERGGAPGTAGLDVRTGTAPVSRRRPGAGSTRRATTASSNWWRTPVAACWWGPRRPARWAARSSGS